jgi:AAHS family 4-hydroxybenzoate transporter-like MFS transporter
MTAWGASRTLIAEFVLTVVLIALLGSALSSYALMLGLTFLIGICVPGAQAGLNALAAMFYPTAIRSTGVGWALGIGRIGSIIGPVIAGMMLASGWIPQQIFLASIIPAALAAVAIVVSALLPKWASAYRPSSAGRGSLNAWSGRSG